MVGSKTVFFMDEISTGLDSSTTYAIVKFLRDQTHALNYTTMVSLLQPAPESYDLFDDILLLAEGTPILLTCPSLVKLHAWVLCCAYQTCVVQRSAHQQAPQILQFADTMGGGHATG